MSRSAMGIDVTDVDTEAKLPLGYIHIEPATSGGHSRAGQGERRWVYIFNDEASAAFAAGEVVVKDPDVTTEPWFGGIQAPVTTHTAKPLVLGVAQHAIAAGSYGFVLEVGVGTILAGSAGVTADTAFTTGGDAAGTVLNYADDTAGANIAVIGHAATAIGASATGTAWIDCR